MDPKSMQDLIIAADQRREIIKVTSQQNLLKCINNDLLERTVKEVNEISKKTAKLRKSRLDLKLKITEQRKILQTLLLKAKEKAAIEREANNEKRDTALRLIEKQNFTRKLILILLANGSTTGTEYRLAISRDLIDDKSLTTYQWNK